MKITTKTVAALALGVVLISGCTDTSTCGADMACYEHAQMRDEAMLGLFLASGAAAFGGQVVDPGAYAIPPAYQGPAPSVYTGPDVEYCGKDGWLRVGDTNGIFVVGTC